ncbi:hypothetical protein GA0116948_103175 [Chitinophaga costaii]|uniref:Uncharacterized protein n=1 Tax=Chitinophaga costaii TaxID=1335309 RepID=A0A1C4BMP7_9BACT|nr:hypothetical protein GA0116948_103175 [Chitinophaga costaii]
MLIKCGLAWKQALVMGLREMVKYKKLQRNGAGAL